MSRTATWHAPAGQVHNQIDFILTPKRFQSKLNEANTRYFPGAHIGSDHDLVPTTIQSNLQTKCFTKSPHIRFDPEKLKTPKIAVVFPAEIGGKFAAVCILDSDVDTLANSLKEVLLPAAEEALGNRRGRFNLRS